MSLHTFTVTYSRGFQDKGQPTGPGVRINNYTNNEFERYGMKSALPSNVPEHSKTLSLETLISTFNNIIKTYKLNPDTYFALNNISEILTNEESVVKYALIKLNGTQGRCVTHQSYINDTTLIYHVVSYIPVLKETKKHLLTLFNKFIKCKEKNEDSVMYEGHQLFIHLFAIIIDSFHVINHYGKKECTDIFPMITLLELLLNKKY